MSKVVQTNVLHCFLNKLSALFNLINLLTANGFFEIFSLTMVTTCLALLICMNGVDCFNESVWLDIIVNIHRIAIGSFPVQIKIWYHYQYEKYNEKMGCLKFITHFNMYFTQ